MLIHQGPQDSHTVITVAGQRYSFIRDLKTPTQLLNLQVKVTHSSGTSRLPHSYYSCRSKILIHQGPPRLPQLLQLQVKVAHPSGTSRLPHSYYSCRSKLLIHQGPPRLPHSYYSCRSKLLIHQGPPRLPHSYYSCRSKLLIHQGPPRLPHSYYSTRQKPLTTSFRKCHILKIENPSPSLDSNTHSSIGGRLGKQTF